MIRKYVRNRWRVFADYTTLHGVKEIEKAPLRKLKILWLFILTLCFFVMLYQIFRLTAHYLTEPVTTMVTVKQDFYQLPLFMLVAHTPELLRKKGPKDFLDEETFLYARSLVDKRVVVPKEFDFDRARKKFDDYLTSNSGMSWHDVLQTYVSDLSPWISANNQLRVQRSMWNVATYHRLELVDTPLASTYSTHDYIVEVPLSWDTLGVDPSVSLILTSFGLLTDATRLEPGHIYKIRFDITSQKRVPLRRKPCREGATQYSMYDQQRCNETCVSKAEQEYAPRKCYRHSDFNWGFYEMYSKLRPCSNGYYNSSGGPFSVEKSEPMPGAQEAKMKEAYEKCFSENCRTPACEQLSVKFLSTSREFGRDLGNRSLLFITWPAPNAITVYDETLQYTWDGFVGQLGGLIGLWMGASMVTAVEIFYLCCCCCFDINNENVDEDEFEDEEMMNGMNKKKGNRGAGASKIVGGAQFKE